jgi:AraC family transcriptional regulator of adaptative response / methylphosphotriester-DNA alkyltransferase methyltransferase
MTQDEMWLAVSQNAASADGLFFYAVNSTGVFCPPACSARRPKRANGPVFDTAGQAMAAGFRPCKRCRSDLADYRPVRDIAEKARRLLDDSFRERCDFNRRLRQLGISARRMAEIFQEEYGVTPAGYAGRLRIAEAKRLLSETGDEITDVAYAVGFGGLSSFYRFFKKETGMSPAAYRKGSRT